MSTLPEIFRIQHPRPTSVSHAADSFNIPGTAFEHSGTVNCLHTWYFSIFLLPPCRRNWNRSICLPSTEFLAAWSVLLARQHTVREKRFLPDRTLVEIPSCHAHFFRKRQSLTQAASVGERPKSSSPVLGGWGGGQVAGICLPDLWRQGSQLFSIQVFRLQFSEFPVRINSLWYFPRPAQKRGSHI